MTERSIDDLTATSTAVSAAPERLEQLDALRGLAALAVVFWHWINVWLPPAVAGRQAAIFRSALAARDPRLLAQLGGTTLLTMSPLRVFFSGAEAVILFFVLSGFVLSLPFWSGQRVGYKAYLVKRIFRIYVPYLAALGLAVAGDAYFSTGSGIPGFNQWFNVTWQNPPDRATVEGHILLVGAYRDADFNTAFWSLIHEMRISIVFPLAMGAMKAAGKWGKLVPLPLTIAGAWLSVRIPVGRVGMSFEVLGLFLAGACLAKFRHQIRVVYRQWSSTLKTVWFAASLGLYSFGWLWIFPAYALGWSLAYKDVFVAFGASGLIVTSVGSVRVASLLVSRVPQALGKVSYSLYLLHGTVLWGVVYALNGRSGATTMLFAYLALLAPSTWLFWLYIEEPSRLKGRYLAKRLVGQQGPRDASAD